MSTDQNLGSTPSDKLRMTKAFEVARQTLQRMDLRETGLVRLTPEEFNAEHLQTALLNWWEVRRPNGWTLDMYIANPTVNCQPDEKELAIQISLMIKGNIALNRK